MSRVVRRFDVGELAPPQRMPNGWLRVEGRISRIGIQEYQDAEGRTHFEFRPPEEVFDPESIKSFEMVPVTNTHPTQLLDDKTARMYTVGTVGQALRQDGDWLAAPLMITDSLAIAAAEHGRAELSCGYECEIDPTPGVYEGQRYDSIQRRIRGNHVALVDEARAGHGARLRLDAFNWKQGDRIMTRRLTEGDRRAEVKLRGDERRRSTPFESSASLRHWRATEDDRERVATGDDDQPGVAVCPACDGAGELEGDDGEMQTCDICDGAQVVHLQKVNAKDAEALRSKLGFYGGSSRNKPPREAAAPFQPPPKGGTPRDEEAQVKGAAAAHRDAHPFIPKPHRLRPLGGGDADRARADAARSARERRMQEIPFNQADANSFVKRLRADGWPGRKK